LKVKVQQQNDTTDSDTTTSLYQSSCHLGNPAFVALVRHVQQQQQQPKTQPAGSNNRRRIPPTIVIIGDFWNAFQSMKRRTWLNMNIAKNLYGSQACRSKWENSLPLFPTDPAGIKMMMLAHIVAAQTQQPQQQQQQQQQRQQSEAAAPIVFLQAPYTRESILQALQLLLSPSSGGANTNDKSIPTTPVSASVERHLAGFQVRPRGTQYKTAAAAAKQQQQQQQQIADPLLELYQPYVALEDILTRMPSAWNALDTPRELLDYLVKEFQ
jgi:hypothetical protein